mmetsp:Transcript_26501/g.41105  ORF Transcript_26501/g.41105 Transcript_26501/m.41105 type:complete len:88 (+) Transcript_26501:277-540(+)
MKAMDISLRPHSLQHVNLLAFIDVFSKSITIGTKMQSSIEKDTILRLCASTFQEFESRRTHHDLRCNFVCFFGEILSLRSVPKELLN